MPTRIHWLLEKRLVLVCIRGRVTLAEIRDRARQLTKVLDAVDHPVDLIFDLSQLEAIPLLPSTVAAESEYLRHEKLGQRIYVGARSKFVQTMIDVSSKTVPFPYHIAHSYEEACQILARADPSISARLNAIDWSRLSCNEP